MNRYIRFSPQFLPSKRNISRKGTGNFAISKVSRKLGFGGLVVFFTLLFLPTAPDASYSQIENEHALGYDHLLAIVNNTNLAFVGTVVDARYECQDGEKSVAYVDVIPDEFWYGFHSGPVLVRVARAPHSDCAGWVCETHPATFSAGERYLFLCSRDWSWEKHDFEKGIYAPVGGVLCVNDNQEVSFCRGGYSFLVEEPGANLKELFRKLSIPNMYEEADLVVVGSKFSIQGKSENFEYEQPHGSAVCDISEVLKGQADKATISFSEISSFKGLNDRPLVSSGDRAVLFLEKSEKGEYGLLYSGKSYCVMSGEELLNNYRMQLGYRLNNGNLVSGGIER